MPYVPAEDRPVLDKAVNVLGDDIVGQLVSRNGSTDISQIYRKSISDILTNIYALETGGQPKIDTPAGKLGTEIFRVAEKYNYSGAWLGELNYSVTRLIQVVPQKMVAAGHWKEELRYWLYAQTVGAIEQSALTSREHFEKEPAQKGKEWVADGFVGVLFDIKDEYKRRVNTAYEAVQIRKSGDAYDTPYRTEVVDVPGGGFQEVMRDLRKAPQKSKVTSAGE